MTSAVTMPVPTVCATCEPKNRKATKLKNAAQTTAYCGAQHAGRHDGGDGIRRVVQAVEKIEHQRDGDQSDQQRQRELTHALGRA